jgi:transaldolase
MSEVHPLARLNVKLFADGADPEGMRAQARKPSIAGLTTNPSLMKKAGVADYEAFARSILEEIPEKPISFEVFSDDFPDMERQALKIAAWGDNVYVKLPITNTKGESALPLVRRLAERGVKVNVTALMTLAQVRDTVLHLSPEVPAYVSVFAGRVADTGRDPLPLMRASVALTAMAPRAEVIWASTREPYNVIQADETGCQIITVPNDILDKLAAFGRDLDAYSLDTVKTFHADAEKAGFKL